MLVFDLSLGLARSEICHDCLINVECSDNKKCTKCHHESYSHPSRDYKQQPTLKILLILIFNQPRTMTGQSHRVINTFFLYSCCSVRNRYLGPPPPRWLHHIHTTALARPEINSFVRQNNIYIVRHYQLCRKPGLYVLCAVCCRVLEAAR